MWMGSHGEVRRCSRWVAVAACLAVLSGCNLRPSAPESRAVYFLEKFIQEPQSVDDLNAVTWLADGQAPDSLIADVPTRTAIIYLRARSRLGASLGIRAVGKDAASAATQVVQVTVSEGGVIGGVNPVRFDITLERRETEWRVLRLHAD